MKITNARIDGFGVWTNLQVDQLTDRMTVFFGPNEAGKTTLMQFVRSVMYGFDRRRKALYLPPLHGGAGGGTLGVEAPNGRFDVSRRANLNEHSKSLGEVTVTGSDGKQHGQHLLNHMLSGVDETIYNNVFAVGIRELQELGTLNDTQAAEHLYRLASGVDRVSLVDVMRNLQKSRDQIATANSTSTVLSRLIKRRQKLQEQLEQHAAKTEHWTQLYAQLRSLNAQIESLDAEILRMERDSRAVEVALQIYDRWREREQVDAELDELGPLQDLPADAVAQLDDLQEQIRQHHETLRPIKVRRREIRQEAAALPINEKLWSRSCRIESIVEHGPWLASLTDQIKRAEEGVSDVELKMMQTDEQLGVSKGMAVASLPDVSRRMMGELKSPYKMLRLATRKRKAAREAYEASRRDTEKSQAQYNSELAERNIEDLKTAIEVASEKVQLYRKRIRLDERLEKMARHLTELDEDREEFGDEDLLPTRSFVGIGVLFTLGMTLVATGVVGHPWFNFSGDTCVLFAFSGFAALLATAVWFLTQRRSLEFEQNDAERQMDKLEALIDKTKAERAELDATLPKGGGSMDVRLASAEAELRELEAILPMSQTHSSARKRREAAKRRLDEADDALKRAKSRWKKTLNSVGLPSTLSPSDVKRLGEHTKETTVLQTQLTSRQEEMLQRKRERTELVQRIAELSQQVGLELTTDDPQAQLAQLAAAVTSQREMVERRRRLQREDRELKRQYVTTGKSLRELETRLESLFEECEVDSDEELRELAANLETQAELCLRRDDLSQHIASAVSDHCTQDEIGEQIEELTKTQLEQKHESLVARLHRSQTDLTKLHERRGQCTQEMRTLGDDRTIAEVKLELGCVQRQMERACSRWRMLTAMENTLETVRDTYESDRQPETLSEASQYLGALTEGKYMRIWTPLSENTLRVDDERGVALPLDVLSRGTREAVFLSLRLALVTAYARRGIILPVVLDDVLVNLDAARARAAVRVLRDFANSGYQVLFFTCHEHMVTFFQDADVEVRQLPSHLEAGSGHVLRPSLLVAETPLEEDVVPEPEEEEVEVAEEEVEVAEEEVVEEPVADEPVVAVVPEVNEEPEEEALEEANFDISDDPDLVDELRDANVDTSTWQVPEMWWDANERATAN